MSVEKWDPIAAEAEKEDTEMDDQVTKTINEINEKGFCFWQFNIIGDAIVCVVRNVGDPVPEGYPVYAFSELEILLDANEWTWRMILEAKRLTGAVIIKRLQGRN